MHIAKHKLASGEARNVAVRNVSVSTCFCTETGVIRKRAPESELRADALTVNERLSDRAANHHDVRILALGSGRNHSEETIRVWAHIAEHVAHDFAIGRLERIDLQLFVEIVNSAADWRHNLAAQ